MTVPGLSMTANTDETLQEQSPMPEPARQHMAHMEERHIVPSEPTSMMDVIAQAISNPNVGIDALERLTGLYERLTDRQAETAFNDAMSAAQADLGPVAADANNPQTKSKYASYPALDRSVRPVYSRHGFALSFGTSEGAAQDYVRITCRVSHRAGHSRDYHVDMPADGKGAKGGDVMTKTHAVGAAMSYGQRYLLKLIFNIAVGEDTDGNSNGGRSAPKMSQAAQEVIATLNALDTPAALVLWKKNDAQAARPKVSEAEWQEIVQLWNRRAASMKSEHGDD